MSFDPRLVHIPTELDGLASDLTALLFRYPELDAQHLVQKIREACQAIDDARAEHARQSLAWSQAKHNREN